MEEDATKKTSVLEENNVKALVNSDFAVIDEYFANGYNGTKAILKIRPGLTYSSARSEASRIFSNTEYNDYIAKKRYDLSIEANTTINRLVKNLGLIANATIADYIGLSEEELKELPYEQSYPLKKITKRVKTFLSKKGEHETETTTTIELNDKIKAIDMLGKHLGIYEVHNQQKQRTIDLSNASPEQLNAILSLIEQQKQLNVPE